MRGLARCAVSKRRSHHLSSRFDHTTRSGAADASRSSTQVETAMGGKTFKKIGKAVGGEALGAAAGLPVGAGAAVSRSKFGYGPSTETIGG